jgi:hypothetical protein
MRRYPLHKNDIKVRVEPKPTTSVIPFAKEAVVGRTIHMCFQEPDSMHLYKGKVTYYDEGAGTFHIDFFDEDTADIDFVSGGDTILWETMDVTRDAQWPEESSDLDIVPVEEEVEEGTRMEVLPPVVGVGGKVPEHVQETKVEDGKEEVTVQPPEQEQQKEDVEKEEVEKEGVEKEDVEKEDVGKEEVEKDALEDHPKVEHEKKEDVVLQPVEERHKEEEIEVKQKEEEEHVLSPAPSIMDGVVLGKKSPAKPMVSEKQAPMQEKSQKDGVDQGAFKTFVGVKRKEGAIMKEDAVKHAKVEKEDGVAKVPTISVQDGLAQRHEKDAPATGTVFVFLPGICTCYTVFMSMFFFTQN